MSMPPALVDAKKAILDLRPPGDQGTEKKNCGEFFNGHARTSTSAETLILAIDVHTYHSTAVLRSTEQHAYYVVYVCTTCWMVMLPSAVCVKGVSCVFCNENASVLIRVSVRRSWAIRLSPTQHCMQL